MLEQMLEQNFVLDITLPDTSNCEIYCRQWGNSDSSKIIFCVHGLTRNSFDFAKLAATAAERGFRVIAPDMPGRGKSQRLTNSAFYNNVVNANLCAQLLIKLKISNVFWLGTSMGGMVAMLLANQFPSIITKLVLNDVGCVISGAALARIGNYVGNSPDFPDFAAAEALLRARTREFAIPETEWKDFAENSIEQKNGFFRLAYDPAIADSFKLTQPIAQPIADLQLWPLWEAIKFIPTMLIRGENSDLLSEETAATMQSLHPNLKRYNVKNAGHAPALMTEAEINTVLNFFNN